MCHGSRIPDVHVRARATWGAGCNAEGVASDSVRQMRNFSLACLALVGTAACAASPPPAPVATPVNVATQPPPAPPAETKPPPPVVAPSGLAAWLHVEKPERIASLFDRVGGPAAPGDSCAKGDARACLKLADPAQPVDFAYAPTESHDNVQAVGFSIRSVAEFRAAAEKEFRVTERGPARLALGTKAATSQGDAAAPAKEESSTVCELSAAEGPSHRVICGTDEGVADLGPWLLTSPQPASRDDIARIEIYPAIVAGADKRFGGDTTVHRETRLFARDFGGATLKLNGGDGAAAPIQLDVDVRMKDSRSRWTKVLLAPLATAAPIPDAFARLSPAATAALYLPGGGPFVALLDQLDVFADLAPFDAAKTKGLIDDARAILGRPIVCGYVVDRDEGRAALAKVRRAPDKDRKKAEAALNVALTGYVVCGVQEPVKAAEELARKVVQLAPPSPGESYAVRSGAGLGLPKGSFLLEHQTAAVVAHGAKKEGTSKHTDTMVAVADGDTTWIVSDSDSADLHNVVHMATRLLANPKGAVSSFPAASGTVVTGYVTTLFGGFFWDLATHAFDALDTTLSDPSPGRLQIAVSQEVKGTGGTVSLHVSTDTVTLPKIATRAAVLALPLIALAAVISGDSSGAKGGK